MTQLKIINNNGCLLIDSREVAEMIDKKHSHLLRDISSYKDIIDQNPILDSADFFINSFYTNTNNQKYPCFLLTKKGCELVGNKMTGEKGITFTAVYVNEFEKMEQTLKNAKPMTQLEILQSTINQLVEQDKRIEKVETKLADTVKRQEHISEILELNPTEWRRKVNSIVNKIANQQGGFSAFQDIRNKSYEILESRANCNLAVRLTNKRRKMSLEGVAKSKIDKLNKMDIISDDSRLTEIYLAIVKEMAIKYQVDIKVS